MVSIISIVAMWLLIHCMVKVGRKLTSQAILSDVDSPPAYLQLSAVLLIASAGYEHRPRRARLSGDAVDGLTKYRKTKKQA